MRKFILLILLCITNVPAFAQSLESKGVVLAYHRIDEHEHIDSSLDSETFKSHIEELLNEQYNIIALPDLIDAIQNGSKLPPQTIAITFEGAYRSAYISAIPLLMENNLPFTIFSASESTKIPNHLNWKDLKKVSKYKKASFGILPASYSDITALDENEATRQINKSRIAFKENMGFEAEFFSYPFGKTSSAFQSIAAKQGFKAAFGLHSGPVHSKDNMLFLPRFVMTDQYADLERLRTIAKTLPLTVTEKEPQTTLITKPIKQIGFTVADELKEKLHGLSCHISGQSKPKLEILENRVEIIPEEPITGPRTRVNCTLPASEDAWHWLGMLYHTSDN